MNDCIFCQIIAGTIPSKPVFEDDQVIVIPDIHPAAPVHLLVIPKFHTTDITQMTDAQYHAYMDSIRQIIASQHIAKFRIVHNGAGAQMVPHAHVHVMGSISPERNL